MVSEQMVKLTSWVGMAPKKNRKQSQDSVLEEPVDDQVAPPDWFELQLATTPNETKQLRVKNEKNPHEVRLYTKLTA